MSVEYRVREIKGRWVVVEIDEIACQVSVPANGGGLTRYVANGLTRRCVEDVASYALAWGKSYATEAGANRFLQRIGVHP